MIGTNMGIRTQPKCTPPVTPERAPSFHSRSGYTTGHRGLPPPPRRKGSEGAQGVALGLGAMGLVPDSDVGLPAPARRSKNKSQKFFSCLEGI